MARSDGLESSHANPCVDFRLRAGTDYRRRCHRCSLLVLLGVPAAAALDIERDGPAAGSILALARAAAKKVI